MADKIDNGGPAYPVEMQYSDGKPTKGLQTSSYSGWETGMSLRDWFAGQALSSIPLRDWSDIKTDQAKVEAWARCSYAVADAMIVARKGGA